jgi:hypothetical protein
VLVQGLPPESDYRFKHALIQDAAYENLLKSRRQVLHRRVAEVLRDRFADTAAAEPVRQGDRNGRQHRRHLNSARGAPKGRRDEFVDPYFKGADPDAVVIILKAREPATISFWAKSRRGSLSPSARNSECRTSL